LNAGLVGSTCFQSIAEVQIIDMARRLGTHRSILEGFRLFGEGQRDLFKAVFRQIRSQKIIRQR
jgi:hypothetical protein